jgi:hypothetical protein
VGITQGSGAQQSAVVVQAPPASTQALPQMNGGVPAGLGTHGKPQQSALDAQALPSYCVGSVQSISAAKQRGIPRLSCLHVGKFSELPAQQLVLALHDVKSSLQMPPAGVHALPPSHRPIALLSIFAHSTLDLGPSGRVAEPQQSESSAQISPLG